jgi:DNA-binding transcriptional LysR family regulator
VTPGKWVRTWRERLPEVELTLIEVSAAEAADLVRGREADAVLLRLPTDRTGLSAIPLYTETTVVVVRKDHLVAAADEVVAADLADDVVLHAVDDTLDWERLPGLPATERPAATAEAIEQVAAGAGLLIVPESLARFHHRKDLTYRPVTDAPQSRVALSWLEDETTDLMEHFIGIVRGRTVNSTRGRQQASQQGGSAESRKSAAGKPAAGKETGKSSAKATGRSSERNQRKGSGATGGARRGKPRRRP